MPQMSRCPLIGVSCSKPVVVEDKTFFLAEAQKPEANRERRWLAIGEALGAGFKVRSALNEKGINAFTCKICEMIQGSAYGLADITDNNPNVLFVLGVMVALGKPTVILKRKGQEDLSLNLPSDLNAIEVIPFAEYIDIIQPLRAAATKMPLVVVASTPLDTLRDVDSNLAKELQKHVDQVVKQFQENMKDAQLDSTSSTDSKASIPAELTAKLQKQEDMLKRFDVLGFTPDANTIFLRSNLYYDQKKYDEARAAYNWFLELSPDSPDALNNRANTYDELEMYDEALADCNHSLRLRPDDPGTLNNRGNIYGNLKRYEEVLADYNHSLKLQPDDPETMYNLACFFSIQGNVPDSLRWLEKVVATRDKKYRETAKTDTDFDNIRSEPRFKKLLESA
jgi:tetratricopeptide (TPR) repeat protein